MHKNKSRTFCSHLWDIYTGVEVPSRLQKSYLLCGSNYFEENPADTASMLAGLTQKQPLIETSFVTLIV